MILELKNIIINTSDIRTIRHYDKFNFGYVEMVFNDNSRNLLKLKEYSDAKKIFYSISRLMRKEVDYVNMNTVEAI